MKTRKGVEMTLVSCHVKDMSIGYTHRMIVACLCLTCAVSMWTGCANKDAPQSSNQNAEEKETPPKNLKLFTVSGVVKSIDLANSRARIEHEEIPGYMEAMTMPFYLANTNEWSNISTNDSIMFLYHVTDDRSWIDNVEKQPDEVPSLDELSETDSWRLVREVEALKVGDMLPNYGLTNQFAKPITLDQFRGKVLAMSFIYTRCPIPDFCPKMNRQFLEAQQQLESMEDGPDNYHFLSISFDPVNDTPERLKLYANAYQHDPDIWTFATGKMIDIDALTEQFGLLFYRSEGTLLEWDHNLRTVLIDPDGKIQDIIVGNLWKTDELVTKIVDLARGKELANDGDALLE